MRARAHSAPMRRMDRMYRTDRTHQILLCLAASVCSMMSFGCASDTTGPTPVDPARGYWQLTLNHHAITLALAPPYDTLQLTATPLTATGATLADSGVTTWTTSDTSVRVSATGLLTAIAPANGVILTVSHTSGNVTNRDMAVINVNDVTPVPRFTTLTVQPNTTSLDTIRQHVYGAWSFTVNALDPTGVPISDVVFRVTSTTPAVFPNSVTSNEYTSGLTRFFFKQVAGHAAIVADATVYGVHRVDTLPVTVGWWRYTIVGVHPEFPTGSRTLRGMFAPQEDTVAAGGIVLWKNLLSGPPIDVVFDEPTAAQAVDSASFLDGLAANFGLVIPTQGGGNIAAFSADSACPGGVNPDGTCSSFWLSILRARRFPTVGTYHYHSSLYGTTGVIHVLPEFQVP